MAVGSYHRTFSCRYYIDAAEVKVPSASPLVGFSRSIMTLFGVIFGAVLFMVVPVAEVKVGETVVVRPGEKIPVDGEVTAGQATVDQATILANSSRLLNKSKNIN